MYFSVYMYMVHGPCGFFGCMLGLHCCTGDSLVTVSGGCSPVVHWLLIVEASPVEEHGLWSTQASVVVAHRLTSCGSWALEHRLDSCGIPAQVFNPFLVYSCVWCQRMFQFCSFTCSYPVFPAPLIKETVQSPLCILASFVIDWVTICVWVYLWAFYPVALVCISVFVPVPYYLSNCSFVIQH